MITNAYENARFIGILERETGKRTVHFPTCEKYFLAHGKQFSSLEEAHAEGYEDYPYCIGKAKLNS